MDIWEQIKSTYNRAYSQIKTQKPALAEQLYKTFASCVAMLCHDNPSRPFNQRSAYLTKLLTLSGGPTVREHACLHAAFALGDAVETQKYGLIAYYVDPRFPLPGTWDYDKAYNFSIPYVFGEITQFHVKLWLQENCFDDSDEDIKQIEKIISMYYHTQNESKSKLY